MFLVTCYSSMLIYLLLLSTFYFKYRKILTETQKVIDYFSYFTRIIYIYIFLTFRSILSNSYTMLLSCQMNSCHYFFTPSISGDFKLFLLVL